MMKNATLVSIAPPPVSNTSGGRTVVPPVAVGARVFVDKLTSKQVYRLGETSKDVSAVLYAPVALAARLVTRARVTYLLDGLDEQTMQVLSAEPFVKGGGLSHVEAFLQRI